MSVIFYIKNKKGFFGNEKPMKVKECLSVSKEEIIQFSFDESREDFSAKDFYNSSIADYGCLLLGKYGESGRGFELSFNKENQEYEIRVLTPSTRKDWLLALSYIKDLAKKLGQSKITNDMEELYSPEDIHTFDYESNILFGIKAIKRKDEDITAYYLFGVERPFVLNEKIYNEIISSESPIDKLSDLLQGVQYLDAYSARQNFYRDKDTQNVFGVYTLTQGVDTILPYKPSVEFEYSDNLNDDDVKSWRLTLVKIDGDTEDQNSYVVAGEISYEDFIKRLPEQKYRFIDANYILIEALNKEEILSLL